MFKSIDSPDHEPAVLRNVAELWLYSIDGRGESFGAATALPKEELDTGQLAFSGPAGFCPLMCKREWNAFLFGSTEGSVNHVSPRGMNSLFLKICTAFHVGFVLMCVVMLKAFGVLFDMIVCVPLSILRVHFIAVRGEVRLHSRDALVSVTRVPGLIYAARRAVQRATAKLLQLKRSAADATIGWIWDFWCAAIIAVSLLRGAAFREPVACGLSAFYRAVRRSFTVFFLFEVGAAFGAFSWHSGNYAMNLKQV